MAKRVAMKLLCVSAFLFINALPVVRCGEHPDGVSKVSRAQDAVGNYHFSYSVANGEGEQFREEGTDAEGRVIGSYGLKHFDGTHRIVDYIADGDGFRANMRSNEPGVGAVQSSDITISRSDHIDQPLAVAATSDKGFGRRINSESSNVAYASDDLDVGKDAAVEDETARESRQGSFDDYRPHSPVAYYPGGNRNRNNPSPVEERVPRLLSQRPVEEEQRSVRGPPPRTSEAEAKPLDAYFPPLNPHTAIRRPDLLPLDRDRGFYPSTSTSAKPYIPPYGGFDDELKPEIHRNSPETKRHDLPLGSIYPGYGGDRPILSPPPTPAYGRFPHQERPIQRGFPPVSRFPSSVPPRSNIPRPRPTPVEDDLPTFPVFSQDDDGLTTPKFVLRAVPIPNGIQAVRVDPNTGRVYERIAYPLFLRHDGRPTYDMNILLHNDDVPDDYFFRDDDQSYFDIPLSTSPYRGVRDRAVPEEVRRRKRFNDTVIDEMTLSKPTARDMDWVHRQMSQIEGFNRNRVSNGIGYRGTGSQIGGFDDFGADGQSHYGRPSDLQLRSMGYFNDQSASRVPRHSENLATDDTKEISSKVDSKAPNESKEISESISNKDNAVNETS